MHPERVQGHRSPDDHWSADSPLTGRRAHHLSACARIHLVLIEQLRTGAVLIVIE